MDRISIIPSNLHIHEFYIFPGITLTLFIPVITETKNIGHNILSKKIYKKIKYTGIPPVSITPFPRAGHYNMLIIKYNY